MPTHRFLRLAAAVGALSLLSLLGCSSEPPEADEPVGELESAQTASMTGYLVSAATVAVIDGPLPFGDVIAVGILVVGGISYYVATAPPSYDSARASYRPIQRVRIVSARPTPVAVPTPSPARPRPTSTPCPPCPPEYWGPVETGHAHGQCRDTVRGHRHKYRYNQNPQSCMCFLSKVAQETLCI